MEHAVAAEAEYAPAAQLAHATWPELGCAVPAAHGVQAICAKYGAMEPAEHGTHWFCGPASPTAQSVQPEAPAGAYLPNAQRVHVDAKLPIELRYVLLGQLVQLAAPLLDPYAPAAQGSHAVAPAIEAYAPIEQPTQLLDMLWPETVEYFPTAQVMHAVDPEAANVPAGQLAQRALPALAEMEPGAQAVHTPPTMKDPAAHVRQLPDPAGEKVPGAQTWHTVETSAPVVVAKEPAGQAAQLDAPEDPLKVPGEQLVHAGAPALAYAPAAQGEQVVDADAPVAAEELPAMQLVQPDAPPMSW
jgi:hypothetical protein